MTVSRLLALMWVSMIALSIPPSARAAQKELVFGMSAAFTGVNAELGIEFYRGAMAWFDHVNVSGGINGYRIRLFSANDGYNPEPCFRNTVDFIENHDVFALFNYVGTPTSTSILPLLELYRQRNLRLVFPVSGAQPLRDGLYGEYAYTLRPSYRQETAALVEHLLHKGNRQIGIFYQADAYGRSGWDGVRRALAEHGKNFVAEASYQRGQPFGADFGKQVSILCSNKTDAVICIGTYAACAGFVRDARNTGFTGVVAAVSFANGGKVLELLSGEPDAEQRGLTNSLVFSQVVPSPWDISLPGVRLYRKMMGAYHQKELTGSRHFSYISLEGFLNARLLTAMLRHMGKQPERAAIDAAVRSLNGYDLGVGQLVRFGPHDRQAFDRIFFSTVRNGRMVPVSPEGHES